MKRTAFITLEVVVLITTLLVALDTQMLVGVWLWLVQSIPIRLALFLGDVGVDEGGAVCPAICHGSALFIALSLTAVALAARRLIDQIRGRSVPFSFGPVEQLLAGIALLIVVVNALPGTIGLMASSALSEAARSIGLNHSVALAQALLALSFWLIEVREMYRNFRSSKAAASSASAARG
ncbi:hypothetical protein [Lysobacter terrae]